MCLTSGLGVKIYMSGGGYFCVTSGFWNKFGVVWVVASLVLSIVLFIGVGFSAGPPEHLKERARPLFEIDGVVYVDAADDGFLEVGVINAGLVRSVEARLRDLGVPLQQVRIVVTKPIHELATLRDEVRPLIGGIQIAFVKQRQTYLCTLGFNALVDVNKDGIYDYDGFLTNSHCTSKEFALDGTVHYQPLPYNTVGQEVLDPPPFNCGVGGAKCRWSDAAFSIMYNAVTSYLGAVAMTSGVNDGSLSITGFFKVVGVFSGNAVTGTILRKVGRTTGQTEGLVTSTCADVRPIGSRVIRLCQDIVSAGVQIVGPGDSGSPVFRVQDDPSTPETEVVLYGILWGGTSDGTSFVYSPVSNVERDLGGLKVN